METQYGLFAVADSASFELTYAIPQDLVGIQAGTVVRVPIQKRELVGVFVRETEKPSFQCKEVLGVVPYTRPFSGVQMRLIQWVAEYYCAPLGRTIRLLAPGFLWDSKKIALREKRFSKEGALQKTTVRGEKRETAAPPKELNPSQRDAIEIILKGEQPTTLLHGITGSGKTEVYIEAARQVLEAGRNVLILVPEIALTPQMSSRFRTAFGDVLGVLHSGLTAVEYEREWFRAHHGRTRVILGVRSAVFAPLENVGLIVVDEEHDSSYKCDEFPCYHARDVAVMRAHLEGGRCVLGSATPSLESYFNWQAHKYNRVVLAARAVGQLPSVEVIDVRKQFGERLGAKKANSPTRSSFISFHENLITDAVTERLAKTKASGHQSMIILNRRGYASYALCRVCGNSLRCPNCSVTTTLHKHGTREVCHYCGFQRARSEKCLDCGNTELIAMGAGTQNLETELARLLPELRVDRLDRDVLTSQTRLSEVISRFRQHEVDCLIGTQILAKGHDFSNVTLVVILHVEDGLFLPDFRSSERTFQLITQSAGRSGRGENAGTVLIQSLIPGHPVVELATRQDSDAFLAREIEQRKLGWHPPVSRQILFEFEQRTESEAMALAGQFRDRLTEHWAQLELPRDEVRIAGPYPATLEKLRGKHRVHICVSSVKKHLPKVLVPPRLLSEKAFFGKVRCDVDPYSFL